MFLKSNWIKTNSFNFGCKFASKPLTSEVVIQAYRVPPPKKQHPVQPKKNKQTTTHRECRFFGSSESFFAAWWGWSPSAWAPNIHCNLPLIWHVHGARKAHSSLPSQRDGPEWFPPLFFLKRWKKTGKIFCQLGLFCKLVNFFVQCALGYKGNLWNHPALGYNNYMFTNCQGEAVCCYSLGTWQRQFPIHRQGACCD